MGFGWKSRLSQQAIQIKPNKNLINPQRFLLFLLI